MVYYKEEKKELIIPSGFIYDGCGGSDCEYEIEQAYQSGWTNGYNSGITSDCGEAIEEAYQSGYTAGLEDCPECSGGTCNLETRNISLNNSFDGDETITPTQGYDGFDSVRIVDNGYGQSKYDEGYQAGLEDCPECPTNIQGTAQRVMTQQGETFYPDEGYDGMGSVYVDGSGLYQSAYTEGYQAGQADCPECSGGSSCNLQSKIYQAQSSTMENIFPDAGFDGMSQVVLMTSNLWNEAHQSGYTEGYDGGYDSGYTEGHQSGYTEGYNQGIAACGSELYEGVWCTDENWNGEEVTLTPLSHFASTAAGFSSVTITDCGYGQKKYDQGYQSGYTDGQASCPECDCSSAITEAYQSGYTAGFDDAGTCDCTESNAIAYNSGFTNGYDSGCTDGFIDGHSSGYTDGYNDGWDEGYNQGQELCPSCDIETGATFGLTSAFTGEVVYPTSGSGFDSIEIYDDGYGDAKYQEGYDQGYAEGAGGCTDAITEAYESGLTSIGSIEISFDIQPYRGTSMTPNISGREHSVIAEDNSGNTYSYDYTYDTNPVKYAMRYMTGTNTDTWLKIIYVGGFPAPSIDLKYLQIDIENENVNDLWANSTVTITGVRINAPVNNRNQYNWELGDGGITLHPVSWSFGQSGTYFTPLTIQLY